MRSRSYSGRLELARTAANHMSGSTYVTPFVSLGENVEKLAASKDGMEGGVKEIVQNARQLHTYVVPKAFTVTPQAAADVLDQGPEELDRAYAGFLRRGPVGESEVLFLGGNLSDYRTSQQSNPYRKVRS